MDCVSASVIPWSSTAGCILSFLSFPIHPDILLNMTSSSGFNSGIRSNKTAILTARLRSNLTLALISPPSLSTLFTSVKKDSIYLIILPFRAIL